MARCPNKNTAEYKALQDVYGTELSTNNIINTWQDANNTDVFPTVFEAGEFIKTNKVAFALKQKSFGESVLNNLGREKIIHKYQNVYFINNSNPETFRYDETFLNNNYNRLIRYLEINNIPLDSVKITRTPKSYKVEIKNDIFTPKDVLQKSRSWDTNRSRAVVGHLAKMFPQIKVKLLSISEAETLYETILQWKKTTANFSEVNSFYVDGTAYLIDGRVTDETAIEEMLHPFIDAINVDNPELFNSLLAEAKINFPEMVQEINNAYNKKRNFTQLERDLEIVTQALTRHFKNEYETKPTKSFLNRIQDALAWFMDVIKDLHQYITGKEMPVTAINSNTTFSSLAKLLNTAGIEFKLENNANGKVRYSLTPEKQKIVDGVLDQSNGLQAEIIKRMFHVATTSKEQVESLSANINFADESGDIVVLNEKDHTYYNITSGEQYTSVTTAIKGTLKNQEEVQLNLDIGNDVDALLDALVSFESLESVVDKMKVLNLEQSTEMYERLRETLSILKPVGSVAISQVVVFDEATKLAGTADLVVIDPNGKIKIIDLKTSKNSIFAKSVKDKLVNSIPSREESISYESREWILPEDSLLKQAGVNKLSTAGQHNLQVNMYKRMFENMGYTVQDGDNGAATFHVVAGITGKGKNQKFNGELTIDGLYQHPESQERDKIDKLIPASKDNLNKQKLDAKTKDDPNQPYVGKEDESVDADEPNEKIEYPEYNTIFGALEGFAQGLIAKQAAMDNINSKIFLKQGAELTRNEIAKAVALISINLGAGSNATSRTYTAMLRYGLREIREFKDYVSDPNNVTKREYITYVLNFNRFLSTYESLYAISESSEINATQRSLVLQMQIEVNKLIGTTKTDGIINEAISDFVLEQIRLRSNKNFGAENSLYTEDDLKKLIVEGTDIDTAELLTKDMATQPDTLLAVMDKIYKVQKQILLDKINYRESAIRKSGNKLLKLSASSDKNKIFDFMLEYDDAGNFTGFYTKPIGQRYYQMAQDIRSELSDSNGTPYEYRDILNLENAKQEDIDYNIDLANKKRAYSDFLRGERTDDNGDYIDGMYHAYNQEFKDARNRFEVWVGGKDKYGQWLRKKNVSDADFAQYQAKYYNFNGYTRAIRINGEPTGQIQKNETFRAVKDNYIVAREFSGDGVDMRSDNYKALYDPSKADALTMAQREFYELFVRYYENELLNKLPAQTKNQMAGRVPLVKSDIIGELKQEGSVFNRMYANTVRSWNNLTQETAIEKNVQLNEQGNFVNSLPVYFTGSVRVNEALEKIDAQISVLKDNYKAGKIGKNKYDEDYSVLNATRTKLKSQPSLGEVSTDMVTSLIKFSAMAEHYEVMGEIEDTLSAFVKVIENRTYSPSPSTNTKLFGRAVDGTLKKVGYTKENKGDSNVIKRARKFMSMIFYDNELVTKGAANKIADGLIQASSLTYVAFNPLGNFNNYVMGRLNNNIEMLGSKYFSKNNFLRAGKEYNLQALQSGIFQRLGSAAIDIADIATLGKAGIKASTYDPDLANNKYEAFVDLFRMMDDSTDIRESGRDKDGKTIWERFTAWGYVLQDAAEYNVQTRVGIAMLMDTMVENSSTNESMSLYDAYNYNSETHKVEIQPGYDTVIKRDGTRKTLDDNFRYEFRNEIREVNKQIHGNYAKEDRIVLQSYVLGNLAVQFKKWVAPAIRSRFQRAYFDENLGHIEGRYRSFWKFIAYVKQQIFLGNRDFSKYKEEFLKEEGFTGQGGNRDQYAMNKILGVYRTLGEAGIILSVMAFNMIFDQILTGDDDDSDTTVKLKHALKKQGSRTYLELVAFVPISPAGWEQLFGMIDSPIATTKTLGELTEAITTTIWTPYGWITQSEREFYANSDYVYQNKPRKGELKLAKEWKDAIPILYTIQKWDNLIKEQEYSIKY